MARRIYISKFNQITKAFDEIASAIEDISKVNDDEKREASINVAEKLAETIESKYADYVQNKISNFEHGTEDVHVKIDETKNGCVVKIVGKDVLYHEYGTGSRGLEKPHPRHNADGMKPYGSGKTVIRGTEERLVEYKTTKKKIERARWMYFNKNNGKRTPYWYPLYVIDGKYFPNDLGGQPTGREFLWRHNGIITKGLPAGRFVYDSINDFKNNNEIIKHTKKVVGNTIKERVVPRIRQKTKRVSQQLNSNQPEVVIERDASFYERAFGQFMNKKMESR